MCVTWRYSILSLDDSPTSSQAHRSSAHSVSSRRTTRASDGGMAPPPVEDIHTPLSSDGEPDDTVPHPHYPPDPGALAYDHMPYVEQPPPTHRRSTSGRRSRSTHSGVYAGSQGGHSSSGGYGGAGGYGYSGYDASQAPPPPPPPEASQYDQQYRGSPGRGPVQGGSGFGTLMELQRVVGQSPAVSGGVQVQVTDVE